ncbi:MAG: hypothetical protein EA358_05420 [Flavobacteriales bacterium]|nr:MAG: hypothetical protein EA358_05420 [Flavobacteriales bacterium]
MKNSHLILFFSVIALFACLTSCQKDDTSNPPLPDELPPITQTGEQTFGCLLNGEVWVPKHYSNSIVNPPVLLQANWDIWNGSILNVYANHHRNRNDENSPREILGFRIHVNEVKDTVFFQHRNEPSSFFYEKHQTANSPLKFYVSTETNNSWIYFSRLDTTNRIASGTFSVDLLNFKENTDVDTVYIREGRFDVRF